MYDSFLWFGLRSYNIGSSAKVINGSWFFREIISILS
jgi:hypothetical protein